MTTTEKPQPILIQRPSLGRPVLYVNNEGVEHSARISRLHTDRHPSIVDLHIDVFDFMSPTKIMGGVRHDLGGGKHTWRYLLADDEVSKIEVAK